MVPHKSRKSEAQASASASEDSENGQQSSQDDAMGVMIAAQGIVAKNNERRDKKRKAIEGEHEKRVKDAKVMMDTLFAARKSRVSKSQQATWTRLDALNKKRENIEGLILASMKCIESNSMQLSGELAALFDGRLKELAGVQSGSSSREE